MSIFKNISNALDSRLSLLVGIPDVAWPNVEYSPSESVGYLRVTNLPNTTVTSDQGFVERHGGIYQVDVVYPTGNGRSAAETLADSVADHFSSSRSLSSGGDTITIRAVSRGTGQQDGAWYLVPVFIEYVTYSIR